MLRVRGLALALAVVVALGVASGPVGRGGGEARRVVDGAVIGVAAAPGPGVGRRWA
jgi:hypothetical protein